MASSGDRETSSKKANEDTENVKTFNEPKQELRKLEHAPHLSGLAVAEKELKNEQRALATSNDHILIYDSTKFLLFDQQFNQIKECEWKEYDPSGILTIDDLTYLSCQNSFLVLTRTHIYELNIDLFEMNSLKEFSKKEKSEEEKLEFASLTAQNEHIFVAYTGSTAISKWTWKPTLQLMNRWTKAKVLKENDQKILSIRTDGVHVGLLIKGESTIRLEVFDYNLSTRIVQHLEISSTANILTSLSNNQWLIIDSEKHELYFVDEENQLKKTEKKDSSPINAARLGNDYLIIKCEKPNKLQIFKLD